MEMKNMKEKLSCDLRLSLLDMKITLKHPPEGVPKKQQFLGSAQKIGARSIVHHTCTKHPFKEHEISCTKIKYTTIKTF